MMTDQQVYSLRPTDEDLVAWTEQARRDDWHLRFVGSDIRLLIGEVQDLRKQLADAAAGAETSPEVAAIAGELLNLSLTGLDDVAWDDEENRDGLLTKIHKVAASALGQRQ